MNVGVIDYSMGNITSVINAIRFLDKSADLVDDPNELDKYDTIVLPGVGAFSKAMEILRQSEMDKAIIDMTQKGKKLVGICLGMQLLFAQSHEFGLSTGLDLVEGEVLPFSDRIDMKIPHMGWNYVNTTQEEYRELTGDYYFVHSFYCAPTNTSDVLFTANYGIEFCCGVNVDEQIFGFQYHPEKSQKLGLQLLQKVL